MARSRSIYTLREVAGMIGENFELMQELTAKSDNIAEGELVYVRDGSEDGTKGLTKNGIDDLQNLLADIRTWDGGIRQFLVYEQCDPEMIERVTAGENAFGGRSPLRSHTRFCYHTLRYILRGARNMVASMPSSCRIATRARLKHANRFRPRRLRRSGNRILTLFRRGISFTSSMMVASFGTFGLI
jgi:hypothetical protein